VALNGKTGLVHIVIKLQAEDKGREIIPITAHAHKMRSRGLHVFALGAMSRMSRAHKIAETRLTNFSLDQHRRTPTKEKASKAKSSIQQEHDPHE
jgi:hypothetical protein